SLILVPRTLNIEYLLYKRTKIIVGYNLGLSQRALVTKEGVLYSTISGLVSWYKVQKLRHSSPQSGRPKSLKNRDLRLISRLIAFDPFVSSKKIKEEGGFS
ncbi:hypothetical protein QBC32DRAFT_198145, partial [Pseudoneurospora amorphoporcata]